MNVLLTSVAVLASISGWGVRAGLAQDSAEIAGLPSTSHQWQLTFRPNPSDFPPEEFDTETLLEGLPDGDAPDEPAVELGSAYQLLDVRDNTLDPSPRTKPSTPLAPAAGVTRPEASSAAAGEFPAIGGSFGLEEFIHHFAPHEPMYFVGGTKAPNVKFQFSIRYRILNPQGPLATQYQLLKGFNFAYSQTSLWDVSNTDQPFFYDSAYRPEFFYYLENLPYVSLPQGWQVGLQGGVGHESNGLHNPDHRSLNIVYLRPVFSASTRSGDLFVTVAPKFYYYIAGLSLNRDLPKYRGYCDMRVVAGQRDGLQLAVIGRLGSDFNKGSAQFDLTYPLTKLFGGNIDVALDAQYFVGYGDTLLSYNRYSNIFRIGLAVVR